MLGAGDLVMLAIRAAIGAGPALVFSFLLLGGACALAALRYAERASMIPQAGSAYAYGHATLGEFVAWITWLLLRGVREHTTASNALVVVRLLALGFFIAVGLGTINSANYQPLANDLTNIGTLLASAFALVCLGVLVLRVVEPERPRPFRVPLVWLIAPLGAVACGVIMIGLPPQAWERFGLWLAAGLVVCFAYGYRHSRVRDV